MNKSEIIELIEETVKDMFGNRVLTVDIVNKNGYLYLQVKYHGKVIDDKCVDSQFDSWLLKKNYI